MALASVRRAAVTGRRARTAALGVAALVACDRAMADTPALPGTSQEISPAPERAMHRTSASGSMCLLCVTAESRDSVGSAGPAWGVRGGVEASGVVNGEWLSEELGLNATIGGGSSGVEGQLNGRLLFGWRGYVTDWQGPFARIGGEWRLFDIPLQIVSLPAAVAGYELMDGRVALDVGLHGALAEAAVYRVFRATWRRTSDLPLLGGYAWMVAPPVQAGLHWDRLWPHDAGPLGGAPIDEVGASACFPAAWTGLWRALLVCGNLNIVSGPTFVPWSPSLYATSELVSSITLGLGFVLTHAAAPP